MDSALEKDLGHERNELVLGKIGPLAMEVNKQVLFLFVLIDIYVFEDPVNSYSTT